MVHLNYFLCGYLIIQTPFVGKAIPFPIVFSQHLCKILIDHKCKDLILGSQFCFIDLDMFSLLAVHVCPFYVKVFQGSVWLATLYSSASSLTIFEMGAGVKSWVPE